MITYDHKLSNPKDGFGSKKLPFHLIPDTALAYETLAFLEGALKYGKYNWRVAGVRMSIYMDAFERHYRKFKNGEWADPTTKVPHLASMRACLGIILDARVCNKLTDDRPPAAPVAALIDSLADDVAHLKNLYKDENPHQHTIEDEVNVETFHQLPTAEPQLAVAPTAVIVTSAPQRMQSDAERQFQKRLATMNDDWQLEADSNGQA